MLIYRKDGGKWNDCRPAAFVHCFTGIKSHASEASFGLCVFTSFFRSSGKPIVVNAGFRGISHSDGQRPGGYLKGSQDILLLFIFVNHLQFDAGIRLFLEVTMWSPFRWFQRSQLLEMVITTSKCIFSRTEWPLLTDANIWWRTLSSSPSRTTPLRKEGKHNLFLFIFCDAV